MTSAGEIALRLQDQGWRGLLPLLPHDAAPHIRLAVAKAAKVEAGRGKAPGRWARAGWSLLHDWRVHPDDAETVEGWAGWPGVNVGLRACHALPWVAFIDVDVLHATAAGELMELLRRRLHGDEFIWRVGDAPKFLIPVRVTEPVTRSRSAVVEIDGRRHMVELLGQGQQAVVAGIHPKTMRPYVWPAGGLEETEPIKLPLVTPAELSEIIGACSAVLLRHGPAVGRRGRGVRAGLAADPKPLSELRARDPVTTLAAAEFVLNNDWSRDDWVAWAYALRGAFGDEGKELWLRFSAQSAKATNLATAEKVWSDATQAERDGHLRAGAGTIIAVAREEGWTPPPVPGLPPYFADADLEPDQARADLRIAVMTWVEQGLAYTGKGEVPRDAIAGAVGLGKTTVTLEVLALLAQGRTVHYYAPTLELGAEIVVKAKALGLDAVMIRGREANKKDPARWPALCQKEDVAATLGRVGRNVWDSLCRHEDDLGNITTCEFFAGCPYVRQFDQLEGKLIVLAHEYLTLPKKLLAKPALAIVDERFHTTLLRPVSLPLERVTAHRSYRFGVLAADAVDALAADAGTAMRAVESGLTMNQVGLTPERLRRMAEHEEKLAEPPVIWPDMPYVEQQSRARLLQEIEAFRLAKLWRILAQDHDRVSQRVVIARGIAWKGELQDRVFIHKAVEPKLPSRLPVLLLDADHDPLIGAVTLPTSRRTVIRPRLNAEIIQLRDTAGSKRKLLESAARRAEVLALARREAAQDRRVLIGTYKPVAELLRTALADLPDDSIQIAHFGAIRGLDGWKDFDTVIVAGREQPKAVDIENMARCLFGAEQERLLLTGEFVPQMRGHLVKDGSQTAVTVQVHPDLRVQALIEQAREREIEQMVGRLRLVHRGRAARVLLLTNLPTALPVDRFTTWKELMPDKLEQAVLHGCGVLPLSYAELARAHPQLWATAKEAEHWLARKGPQVPLRESYWNVGTLSVATLVSYRRPGQRRGSPHQAILPGRIECAGMAEDLLAAALGDIEQVCILRTIARAGIFVAPAGELPEPLVFPDLRTLLKPSDGLEPETSCFRVEVIPHAPPSLEAAA